MNKVLISLQVFTAILIVSNSLKKQEKLEQILKNIEPRFSSRNRNIEPRSESEDESKSSTSEDDIKEQDHKYLDNYENFKKYSEKKNDNKYEMHINRLVDTVKSKLRENFYKVASIDACSANRPQILTTSASIRSPGYNSNDYMNNMNCSWLITAPINKIITLWVKEIAMEDSKKCRYDALLISDVINNSHQTIARLCGTRIPAEPFLSSANKLLISLITDNSESYGKFLIEFTFRDAPIIPASGQCGKPAVSPLITNQKIVGGTASIPNSWPWQISLQFLYGTSFYHICGGIIISDRIVLSAAHCFFDSDTHQLSSKTQFRIVAGEHDRSRTSDGPTQIRTIIQLLIHESYVPQNSASANDIAILIISPLNFNRNISAACLPKSSVQSNEQCYTTGWGETQNTGNNDLLNQVRIPIIPLSTCKRSDFYGSRIFDSMICAGYMNGGKDSCQGDSGGPFVCLNSDQIWTIDGVVSWGDGCALPNKPGIYTRVFSFLNWIKSKTGFTG